MKSFLQEQPTFLFELFVETPQLVLPVDQENIKKSPCWVFHPGNLSVKADTYSKEEDKVEQMYDKYSVSLKNISMMYCNSAQ